MKSVVNPIKKDEPVDVVADASPKPLPKTANWAGARSESGSTSNSTPVHRPAAPVKEVPVILKPLEPLFTESGKSGGVIAFLESKSQAKFFTSVKTFEEFRNKNLRGKFDRFGRIVVFRQVKGLESDVVCIQSAQITFPAGDHSQIAFCRDRETKMYFSTWDIKEVEKDTSKFSFMKVIPAYPAGYFPEKFLEEHPKTTYTKNELDSNRYVNPKNIYGCFRENMHSSGIVFWDGSGPRFFKSKKDFVEFSTAVHEGIMPTRNGFILDFGEMGFAFPAPSLPNFRSFFDKLTIFELNDGSLRMGWGHREWVDYKNGVTCVQRFVIPAYTADYSYRSFMNDHPFFEGTDSMFAAIEHKGQKVYGWGDTNYIYNGRDSSLLPVKGLDE